MASATVSCAAGLSLTNGGSGKGELAVVAVVLEVVLHSERRMQRKNIRRQMSLFIVIYVNPIKIMEMMKSKTAILVIRITR